jgi:hypothetical protein
MSHQEGQAPEERDLLGALDDYVSGFMPESEADEFEEALFARAAHDEAPEAAFIERLRRDAEWIGRRASFSVGATRAQIEWLLNASGRRVVFKDLGNGSAPVDIEPLPAGLEFYTYRLGVDLRGYDDVDVVVETPSGEHVKTFRDVEYDPADGALYGVCEAPLAEISFRRGTIVSKVMAGHGAERKLIATFETRPLGP